jgi:uncharacterized protein (DUF952 family)
MEMMLIYKIVHADEWREAERTGVYAGSKKDKEDGFLHFSTAKQLRETLERYYADATDLVLVAVDGTPLVDDLKWEHALSRGEYFPHLFAPLPMTAVKWTRALERNAYGDPILEPVE